MAATGEGSHNCESRFTFTLLRSPFLGLMFRNELKIMIIFLAFAERLWLPFGLVNLAGWNPDLLNIWLTLVRFKNQLSFVVKNSLNNLESVV